MVRHTNFRSYVMDQLRELADLTWKPMFGCYGLYGKGFFFGIIWEDRLFFRTDESSAQRYIKKGMPPLQFCEHQKSNSYYEVPEGIMKSPKQLGIWAREAIECQKRRKATKKETRVESTSREKSVKKRPDFMW